MKFQFLFIFIFFASFIAKAQKTLSDYSFVVVPEQFDFVNEKNKYELNSMTQFYFAKYGFNAYLANQVPNVKRCDGLYADVTEERAILATRLKITLKDCNGTTIYTSDLGKSKVKEYKLAYQDALRDAFISVGAQGVAQKDIQLFDDAEVAEPMKTESSKDIKVITKMNEPVTIEVKTEDGNMKAKNVDEIMKGETNLPMAKFSNYKKESDNFLLRKTGEGFSLYQETDKAEDGLLLVGKIIAINGLLRFINANGASYKAIFDDSRNLLIEVNDVNIVYKAIN